MKKDLDGTNPELSPPVCTYPNYSGQDLEIFALGFARRAEERKKTGTPLVIAFPNGGILGFSAGIEERHPLETFDRSYILRREEEIKAILFRLGFIVKVHCSQYIVRHLKGVDSDVKLHFDVECVGEVDFEAELRELLESMNLPQEFANDPPPLSKRQDPSEQAWAA